MRGIPRRHSAGGGLSWISPAHAGNTSRPLTSPRSRRDQPRTCGEYGSVASAWLWRPGSAPHMRGIPRSAAHAQPLTRISPAHAGNTASCWGWSSGFPDQPRTCGEYTFPPNTHNYTRGSAPHMRGIHGSNENVRRRGRISPAHAGNTSAADSAASQAADQPRTCGEYDTQTTRSEGGFGSAPHMRGIPAVFPARRWTRTDQPRTCGEYVAADLAGLAVQGSAPHMRGIRHMPPPPTRDVRISPAHAGNTVRRGPSP